MNAPSGARRTHHHYGCPHISMLYEHRMDVVCHGVCPALCMQRVHAEQVALVLFIMVMAIAISMESVVH